MHMATLALGPEMTIAHAAAWREQLLQATVQALVQVPAELVLDAAAVEEVDSSALQLLLATRHSLQARGARLRLHAPSAVLRDALARLGLQALLPPAAH